jgi:phospholipid-binding lipoprotein MlaA
VATPSPNGRLRVPLLLFSFEQSEGYRVDPERRGGFERPAWMAAPEFAERFGRPRGRVLRCLGLTGLLLMLGTPDLRAEPSSPATRSTTAQGSPSSSVPASGEEPDASALEDEYDLLFEEDALQQGAEGFPDPMEASNRKVLKFNQGVDRYVTGPIAKGYDILLPDPIQFAIRRFFINVNQPVTLVNDALQLEWMDALKTTGAFVVNTTIGLGGLFEPGKSMGLPRHRSDFGQTLALADVPSGPYLMIPFLGPTNIRDGGGAIIDIFLRPATWALGFGAISYIAIGGETLVILETHHEGLKNLEKSALDLYPVLRSAFFQNRMGQIWDRREGRRSAHGG